MANYGSCEISFLRGTWKPCSFHFLSGKVMVSVNKMQFGIFFFLSLQFPRLAYRFFFGVWAIVVFDGGFFPTTMSSGSFL